MSSIDARPAMRFRPRLGFRLSRLAFVRVGSWLASACLLLAASGCGSYSELAAAVTGKVTIDGKPTEGTAVFFIPTDESKHAAGVIGQGYTNASGEFTLENPRGEKSFFSGEFKVTFTRYETKEGKPIPLTMKPSDAGGTQVLPERYMTPAETPFTVEVSAAKTNFSFALESK